MRRTPLPHRLSAAALLWLAPSAANALTLGEAQAVLFRDNPDLAVQELEIEKARLQAGEARASWLPSVDAFATYGYTTETGHLRLELPLPPPAGGSIDRAIGDHDRVETGIDASYAFFTGFSRGRDLQARRLGVMARQAQWRAARDQMSLRLASLFHAWQLAGSQAGYQEKVLNFSREAESRLRAYVAAGTAVRSRLLSARARASAAEVELLAARNMRDSLAYEVLSFLGGRTGAWGDVAAPDSAGPAFLSADTSAPAEPDWGAGADSARPEAEALDLGAAQARLGAEALLGRKWPQLYGSAGWRYANPGLNLAGDEFMGYGVVGAQLKWNLFDGFRNHAQRSQLRVQARELAEQKRKLEQDWRKARAIARLQFGRWSAQYEAARASREAARAAAEDVKRQWDAGMATEVDWLESRVEVARAELAMEQARTMQRLARLQWEYAAGKELRF